MNSNQRTGTTGLVDRFDAYQVCPVVETVARNGEISCGAFHTLAEAFDAKNDSRSIGPQRILWTLYGVRRGIAEAIADRATEADTSDLLYSITGMQGRSGQTIYQVPCSTPHRQPRACRLFREMRAAMTISASSSDGKLSPKHYRSGEPGVGGGRLAVHPWKNPGAYR